MGVDGTDAEPLTRDEFYALYRGGLTFENERRRLTVLYLLLGSGRLGLGPAELGHLHEGWIDWEQGTITIPQHDPCACEDCWKAAKRRQQAGDDRSLPAIVTAEQFRSGENAARIVPFGWSHRITATLATFFEHNDYLDHDTDATAKLLRATTDRAEGLDPDAVDIATLRATAGRFFAEAGCDTEELANVLGIGDGAARTYARRWGSETTTELSVRLGDGSVPAVTRQFPIACDPTPFREEPFDPKRFDTAWRLDRATEDVGSKRPLETPLPAEPPSGVTYHPDDHDYPTHLQADSGRLIKGTPGTQTVSSLPEWVLEADQKRGGALATGDPTETTTQRGGGATTTTSEADSGGGSDAESTTATVGSGETMGPRERVTDPIVVEVSTRFAAADLAGGSPVSGRVILGQEELVYVTDDGDHLVLALDDIVDVAVDYTPDGLEDVFESTVGVSYERDGNTRLSVVELPGKKQGDFASGLLRLLLDGREVTVTHPARKGGRVTNNDAQEVRLSVKARQIQFKSDAGVVFRIRLSDLIHIERGKQAISGVTHKALSVRHCTNDDNDAVTTEISTGSDREFKLLERYLMRDYQRRKEHLQQLSLSADEKEVLVGMYSLDSTMNVSMVMDMSDEEFDQVVGSLSSKDLIRTEGTSPELTGMGQMVVSDKVDDINV